MITPSKSTQTQEVWTVDRPLDAREMADLLWQANQRTGDSGYDDRYKVQGWDDGVRIVFPMKRED